ncbi:MAG: DUF6599 family protein, partial [Desulfobacterales bacterium]
KEPSRLETSLSMMILAVLVLIFGIILGNQSHFNPAVLQPAADQIIGSAPAAPSAAPAVTALFPLPPNVSALTAAETFDRDTLSDKIDGKAELYLSAGFKRLQAQRFSAGSAPETWIEIFVYDMASQKNAFAVYSSQQRDDAVPATAVGRYAYQTANALFWVRGPYYIELIASEASPAILEQMQSLAAAFNHATPVATGAITETALFPEAGLDPKSITLIPADAFGFEKFDRVFVAEYRLDESALSAFISARGSAAEAAELAAAYRAFLLAFGGKVIEDGGLGAAVIVEIMNEYEIIFTRGVYVAGVHAAADRKSAVALARALDTRIGETTGGGQ